MPSTLSPQNPRLARARELLEGRGRRDQGRFLLEGPTLLQEARASGLAIESLFATPAAAERYAPAVRAVENDGVPVFLIDEKALGRLSDVSTPAGIVAVAPLPRATPDLVFARPGPIMLLAGISDPGNAGTLVRSAEAFGAAGVLFGSGGVDPYAPKVVRAAMGSIFRLPVAPATPDEVLAGARASGRLVIAADLAGTPVGEAPLTRDAVIAVGNERHGVAAFLAHWDVAVRIEQAGPAESLNAAVAGSILLYLVSRRA